VITHLPAHNCCPDCGGALRQFGEDTSEQLERRPATCRAASTEIMDKAAQNQQY
jgi:transposase